MCYKCLLVGDGGTGKTSFLKRLATGEFSTIYPATLGHKVQRLYIGSKDSGFLFLLNIPDISGQTSHGDLLKHSDAQCAIIIFDVTSRNTFDNVSVWYREIIQACDSTIPVVIVGNKIDMPGLKTKTDVMRRRFSNRVQFYDISVKTGMNIEKPILWIASKLLQKSPTRVLQNRQLLPENLKIMNIEIKRKIEALPLDSPETDSSSEFSDENDEKHVQKRVEVEPTKRQSRPRTRVFFTYTKTRRKKNQNGVNTEQSKEERSE